MTDKGPIKTAMVLAAGLGRRMRPLTDETAKPLIPFAGKPLVDHVLDRLVEAGVSRAVVNVHTFADKVEAHVRRRSDLDVVISDERDVLLDTGGGVRHALPLLGDAPFFVIASDTVWIEGPRPNLARLGARFDPDRMDMLLLLAAASASVGTEGRGDFDMDPLGHLARRPEMGTVPFHYASALVTTAALYDGSPDGPFSNNVLFDEAIAKGRLFGQRLDGIWMHVGTPRSLAEAETALADSIL